MCLISTMDELIENINTTESYLHSSNPYKRNLIHEIIRKGRCFVCYYVDGEIHFVPSKFIGYKANTPETHDRSIRDGRKTNVVISKILGDLKTNESYEASYFDYVKNLQHTSHKLIIPSNSRRYWTNILNSRIQNS